MSARFTKRLMARIAANRIAFEGSPVLPLYDEALAALAKRGEGLAFLPPLAWQLATTDRDRALWRALECFYAEVAARKAATARERKYQKDRSAREFSEALILLPERILTK